MNWLFSRIKELFLTQEVNLFKNMKYHIQLSKEALNLLIDAQSAVSSEKNKIYKKIEEIEKRGDNLANQITQQIFEGAIIVSLQNYLINLVDILDNILDTIHFLAGETYRKRHFKQLISKETLNIESKIKNYLIFTLNSLEKLIELMDIVLEGKWDKVVEIVSEIEKIEEDGDEQKHNLVDEIYSNWQKIKEPYYSYLIHYIYMIDDIQDLTEDTSNIMLLVIQHIKI